MRAEMDRELPLCNIVTVILEARFHKLPNVILGAFLLQVLICFLFLVAEWSPLIMGYRLLAAHLAKHYEDTTIMVMLAGHVAIIIGHYLSQLCRVLTWSH